MQELCNRIIRSKLGSLLKWCWYHMMPSFPVWRKVFGLHVCFDSRDNPFVWFVSREKIENCEGIRPYLEKERGTFWDLGCNVGIYSLYAASLGWKVIALDLAPKCIKLLISSAERSNLSLTAIARAVSTTNRTYFAAPTATAGNKIDSAQNGDVVLSMTWKEIDALYGTPSLIKMDIEGEEAEFLADRAFMRWLGINGITLLVELHHTFYKGLPPMKQLSEHNFALEPMEMLKACH